jgi:hypothetical protein
LDERKQDQQQQMTTVETGWNSSAVNFAASESLFSTLNQQDVMERIVINNNDDSCS